MRPGTFALLDDRGVLALRGPDTRDFLQGLISNDVDRLSPQRALYAALLTPQGKYLFDFMLAQHDGEIWLDVERTRAAELLQRLNLYRLRAKVAIEDRSDALAVLALPGGVDGLPPERGAALPYGDGVLFVDPRLAALGARAILRRERVTAVTGELALSEMSAAEYDSQRLALGVADGSKDLVVQKSLLLESNFEELDGVSFSKGCYVGQELTARTKHRALVRKRLLPVRVEGPLPAPGTPLLLGEREAGEMRGGSGERGLALLRLEAIGQTMPPLAAGESLLRPEWPAWLAPRSMTTPEEN